MPNDTSEVTGPERPPASVEGLGAAQKHQGRHGARAFEGLERFGVVGLILIMTIVFSALRPDTFATSANWQAIATSQAVLAVAAMALLIPLVGGRFDVSVGSILGLCSVLCAGMMSHHGLPLALAALVAVGIGTGIGLLNGVVVAYLGVNSVIATIGTGTIMVGLTTAYTQGIAISDGLSTTLTDLGFNTLFGIPQIVLAMAVICLIVWFVLTQTPYGRYLTACGSNIRAASLTGINVSKTILISFVLSGALSGVAGVLQIAAAGVGDPTVGGINYIIPALAAVFLGATTWRPGTYNVPGTILSLYFLSIAQSGLALVGVAPWVTVVFNGAAVVIAIVVAAQFKRQRTGALEIGE